MAEIAKKKFFIAELSSGQQFAEVFLVARKSLAETKAGKPYLALTLMDRSGEIEARLWDRALDFDTQATEGNFVLVQAQVKSYRDQLQLNLEHLQRVTEAQVSLEDFILASSRPSEDMLAELEHYISKIDDNRLKNLVRTIFQPETLARFQQAPAAKRMHHAYLGGLLEHTLSVAGMALRAAEHYPSLDQSMLLAGALLHDLGKIEELDFSSPVIQYTDRGRLLGHITLGVEMVSRAADATEEKIPQERLDLLRHILLSHHGQLIFGSPVLPMTPEATLLHHLDDMDAKMNHMDNLRAKMAVSGLQWTDYQRHLERYLYLHGEGSSEELEAEKLSNKGERDKNISAQQQSLF